MGEDTDLLMLMLHHYGREENSSYKLQFQSGKTRQNHNIKHYIATVGKEQCQKLIFIHAFTGCQIKLSKRYHLLDQNVYHLLNQL